MIKKDRGFTLIELLVVIAIIGILATIVLTSLGSARKKATDAKAEAQLSSMRAQAELYYSVHSTYGNMQASYGDCTGSSAPLFNDSSDTDSLYGLIHAVTSIGYTVNCYTDPTGGGVADATAWAVTVQDPDSTIGWCTDSTGLLQPYTGTVTTPVLAACS